MHGSDLLRGAQYCCCFEGNCSLLLSDLCLMCQDVINGKESFLHSSQSPIVFLFFCSLFCYSLKTESIEQTIPTPLCIYVLGRKEIISLILHCFYIVIVTKFKTVRENYQQLLINALENIYSFQHRFRECKSDICHFHSNKLLFSCRFQKKDCL